MSSVKHIHKDLDMVVFESPGKLRYSHEPGLFASIRNVENITLDDFFKTLDPNDFIRLDGTPKADDGEGLQNNIKK